METRRRSRILLKAALGGARQDGARGCHRRLELSDDSETSEPSSVHHSEISNSLKGIGTHYDHDMGWKLSRKKAKSQPRLSIVEEVPYALDTHRISISSSSPIGKQVKKSGQSCMKSTDNDAHDNDAHETPGSFHSDSNVSLKLSGSSSTSSYMDIVNFEAYQILSKNGAVIVNVEEVAKPSLNTSRIEAAFVSGKCGASSVPLLSKLSEEDSSRHNEDHANAAKKGRSSSRPQTAPHLVTGSSSTPKVKKKHHSDLSGSLPTAFDAANTIVPSSSPRLSFFLSAHRPQTKPRHSKRNQVHPVSQERNFSAAVQSTSKQRPKLKKLLSNKSYSAEPALPHPSIIAQTSSEFKAPPRENSNDLPREPLVTSPSRSSTDSRQFSVSASETSRSSVTSVLTPLFTSSLRMRGSGSSSDTRWELGGDSQLTSCFPDRNMRIFIVTWNMQEIKDLPDSLDDMLLPLSQDTAADMFVIGTQESTPARKEWELLIQKTLGPYYVQVQSSAIGVIYLSLFIRRDLIWFCSTATSATFATRPVTIIKTKGAVGISFTLFGSSFLFVTSHFTASTNKVSERNADMHRIASNLPLSDDVTAGGDVTSNFDYVFWFGDLNYRVDLDRRTANKSLSKRDIMPLLLKDQLTTEILQGHAFCGFSEQPITFYPSYKFDPGTDRYDSSEKQRVPSWTDRILFKSRSGSGITGCGYTCCHSIKVSDHRPVCAQFRVKLEPCLHVEGVPEIVASFNRDMYVRANKERNMVLALEKAKEELDPERAAISSRRLTTEGKEQVISQVCVIL